MTTRLKSRGTILVASTNPVFADLVGGMVLDSGFVAAYPTGLETPWVMVARAQPCLVICDCDAPIERIQRLVFDISARRIPLVLSQAPEACVDTRSLTLPPRFALLTLPMSHLAFCAMLDGLLPTVVDSIRRVRASAAGLRIDPAVPVRALSITPGNSLMDGHLPLAGLNRFGVRRDGRTDDDETPATGARQVKKAR